MCKINKRAALDLGEESDRVAQGTLHQLREIDGTAAERFHAERWSVLVVLAPLDRDHDRPGLLDVVQILLVRWWPETTTKYTQEELFQFKTN